MADDTKGTAVEVLPAQPVSLDVLLRAAQPLISEWGKSQVELERERTARAKIELENRRAGFEAQLRARAMTERLEFISRYTIQIAIVLVAIGVIAYGMLSGQHWVLSHALAGLTGALGGWGIARGGARNLRNQPPD